MAQGSRQVQTQAQQQIQTLSPQQILVVKLLELPAVELEDRVRAELLENPALEEGKEDTPGDEYPDTPDTETGTEDGGDTSYDSFSLIPLRVDKCYQHGECQSAENGERNRFKNSPACDSRFKRQNKNLWNGFRSG